MKSFYTQQFLTTLLIASCWFGGIAALSRTDMTPHSHVALRTEEKSPDHQSKTVTEPRDPDKTGETSRVHHRDGFDNERKTEITFADKTQALIEYSVFGKPAKVTETYKDGSSQLFFFDPIKGQLQRIESVRPDGTLAIRSQPVKNTLQRQFFSTDGKTLRCKLSMEEGKTSAEIFRADGTLEARYEEISTGEDSAAEHKVSLKVFDKSGKKLLREETLENKTDELSMAEYEHEGYSPQSLVVKTFWDNGKIRSEQEWDTYGGANATLKQAIDYNEDGKKTRCTSTCYEKIAEEYANFRVENYGAYSQVESTIFVNSSHKVLKQSTMENGALKESTPTNKVLEQSPATPPSLFSYPQEFFRASLEGNHLRQIFSE